ncbi:MAG TPA: right-handed parallel beta-helix repeat-containing protein [Polyangia bacterium]|nr:right-handed parallel beta-helix repeat-containing protein [Polyangia bacterium]
MRVELFALGAALVLLSAACTKVNPHYCSGHFEDDCDMDAADAPSAEGDVAEARDSRDAADVSEVAPEAKPPVCVTDDQCAAAADAGTPACGTSDGGAACVECTSNSHCKGTKSVCDSAAEKCVECLGTEAASGTECKADSSRSVCNKMTQSCVACLDNTKCSGTEPICDTTKNTCRPCTADAECNGIGPGVCVDYDGHCATAGEVVTLEGGAACVALGMLFCKASDAVASLSMMRPILLIKGPDPVGAIDPPIGAAPKLLIVGQGGALVGAGSGDTAGVHLAGPNKFWVRDLKISGGTVGVVAEQSAELHLTRCVVTKNGMGGIKTIDSSFDITNTIIAANGGGTDVGGVAWGGVRLGDIPQSGASRFVNNTVVDNTSIGLSCKNSYDASTNIVHGNLGGETINCTGAACCGAGDPDPLLDASYHLMSGSPCIGKIDATTMSLTIDIQGHPRPMPPMGKLACGADEFVP